MRIPSRRHGRQGNVAITVALCMVVLLSFAAFTIDLGYGRLVQHQLQNASEAAARAGSLQLDTTDDGMAAARAAAHSVAAANTAAGQSVVLAEKDITFGVWDDVSGTFTESDDPLLVNTVQVHARIDELGLFIAPAVFARDTIAVSGATRVLARSGGAGAVRCFLPLAIPSCLVDREGVDGLQDLTLNLNPAGVDSVAWASLTGHPNSKSTRDQLGNCEHEGNADVGDPVYLNNGVISSAIAELDTQIETSSTRWSTTKWGALPERLPTSNISASTYGNTLEGPIIVFDGGPDYCTGKGGKFNGDEPLVAFLWAAVYNISGVGAYTDLAVRIDTSSDYSMGTAAGGPDYGVISKLPPRMVRLD